MKSETLIQKRVSQKTSRTSRKATCLLELEPQRERNESQNCNNVVENDVVKHITLEVEKQR